jgi:hypothetical protein
MSRAFESKKSKNLISLYGLDHGAGHSLLLLCGAKTPRDKKSKEFKALGHYLCSVSIGLL